MTLREASKIVLSSGRNSPWKPETAKAIGVIVGYLRKKKKVKRYIPMFTIKLWASNFSKASNH